MTEFNKEEFVADYVAAVKKNDTGATQEVLARLTFDQGFDQRIELVNEILAQLREEEGNYDTHVEFLNKQVALLEIAKEEESKNSTSEDAKDASSSADEATQDVAADTGANAAEHSSEDAVDGNALTEEEKEGKSE